MDKLATELLLSIAASLDAKSTRRLAQTCKTLWMTLQDRLLLCDKYQVVRVAADADINEELLKEGLTLVDSLKIGPESQIDPSEDEIENEQAISEIAQAIQEKRLGHLFFNSSKDVQKALLPMVLPNLKELFWNLDEEDFISDWDWFEKVGPAILEYGEGQLFDNLTSLTINAQFVHQTDASITPLVGSILGIPSLRYLTISHMYDEYPMDGSDPSWYLQSSKKSEVEFLHFDHTAIGGPWWSLLLPRFKRLKAFSWHCAYGNGPICDWNPQAVLQALAQYHSSTLRWLRLSSPLNRDMENYDYEQIEPFSITLDSWISLQAFSKLESLYFEWEDVMQESVWDSKDVSSLVNALPHGLKTLHLGDKEPQEADNPYWPRHYPREDRDQTRHDRMRKLAEYLSCCNLKTIRLKEHSHVVEEMARMKGIDYECPSKWNPFTPWVTFGKNGDWKVDFR